MRKNIIIIPPCFTYGDCLSIIGLVYFCLNYYEKVYFYLGDYNPSLNKYYEKYFLNDLKFNNRIFLTNSPETLINEGNFGDYDICNVYTHDWLSAKNNFSELQNIDINYYFNDLNPLYNKLNILDKLKCYPNKHLPPNDIQINHLFYYELVGLNNNVRMDFFNYERNLIEEKEIKNLIFKKFNLNPESKYNVINDPIGNSYKLKSYIKNNYPIININYLADCPGQLLTLLEEAEEIHFIEGSNVNFFYHCQYKNIFKYNKKINFHIWLRNRDWPHYKLDYAWKMMSGVDLPNWNFIFTEEEAVLI